MKALFVFFAILALSFSQYPVWSDCAVNIRQWTAQNVTISQNHNVKKLNTISACGYVDSEERHTVFEYWTVNGRSGKDYVRSSISHPHSLVVTGQRFCLNHTTYLPDGLDKNNFNARFLIINDDGVGVGCINISFQNQTSSIYA